MGAFLLSSGAKGKRLALPNSEIMIHQPSGGSQGQCTDIQIQARQILRIKDRSITSSQRTPASRSRPSPRIASAITS